MISGPMTYPGNAGVLENADAVGCDGRPGYGAYMLFTLQVRDGRVSNARFLTHGNPAAIATGAYLAQWATGKTLAQVRAIHPRDVLKGIGSLILGNESCAPLGVNALKDALNQLSR